MDNTKIYLVFFEEYLVIATTEFEKVKDYLNQNLCTVQIWENGIHIETKYSDS